MKITRYQTSPNSDSNAEVNTDADKWFGHATVRVGRNANYETKSDAQRELAAALRTLADQVESDE